MPRAGEPLIRLRGVSKGYHSLRPLRIASLDIHPAHSLALLGLDAAMAEVLVNLITGTSLPDEGEVITFDRRTSDIADSDSWLTLLDRFGLISDRAVLVEPLTAEQSIVMPLSLELEVMPPEIRAAADALSDEVGLTRAQRVATVGHLDADARLRVRLGRALALSPHVLLAEHPNATLSRDEASRFAADYSRIVAARKISSVVITADRGFARAIAEDLLTLQPATGELKPPDGWRRWLGIGNGT